MSTVSAISFAFLVVFALSYLGVAITRPFARRFNHIALPNERSSHLLPIPLGGGLILVLVNVGAWLIFIQFRPVLSMRHVTIIIVGGLLVATISFIDDLGHVPYPIRLAVHGSAALLVVLGFSYWNILVLPVVGPLTLGAFGIVITALWIVGLTNAYNFMDGIDGMAAGQAIAAGLGWVALGLLTQHPILVLIGALLAASSLGFLGHNWQPARIFMGDVGSTFLGFSFAVLPVIGARYDSRLVLAGVLLVWPAIFDSLFTVLRRLQRHEDILSGHRTFLFHRLVAAGWSHSRATLLYISFPVAGAFLAFTWEQGNPVLHTLVGIALVSLCIALWMFVRRQERRVANEPGLRHMIKMRRRRAPTIRPRPHTGQPVRHGPRERTALLERD